ncbi:plasmid replication initiation protein [Bradyrhizobium sp. USDA 4538]|nr:plasmid replication initiation protein [Bradyrhizobium sp. USDA 4538]MCP1898667.1 plasmid replication initiation protein [Bradyrhizobium sp. USDA 4537]MCP1909166.1 plasmid replication initiation protein [Bradyrhizobium elkanii]MCP1987222.1 plasmid replication initiation protein [Bradyrhizobium sp. USDA 4539]
MRKHGGRHHGGSSFPTFVDLHAKSGILSPLKHLADAVCQIVQRQTLPGYQLVFTRDPNGTERLNFVPKLGGPFTACLRMRGLIPNSENNL